MKSAVLIFPGINRDRDMLRALESVTGTPARPVWHTEAEIPPADLIVVPGGFSYGDYLRCGAIAARSPVMADLVRKANAGVLVLGICNGFQILTETGLLPGALMRNAHLHFVCREVFLKVENASTPFSRAYRQGQVIRCPVAHHDGNYFADTPTLDRLEGENQVVYRYSEADGAVTDEANPNGSLNNIAGIINAAGNVLGMMPHPENLIEPLQGGSDGRGIFESLVEAVAA